MTVVRCCLAWCCRQWVVICSSTANLHVLRFDASLLKDGRCRRKTRCKFAPI